MVTAWNVLKRLEHFIEIDSDKKDKALSICVVNLEKVFSILDENSDKDDCRITEAAAAMSFYDYAVKSASESSDFITSFKAGDVSVSKNSQSLIELASSLKRDALNALYPLCSDGSFFITLA